MKLKIKEFEKLAKKRGYRGGKAQNCNKSVPRTYRNFAERDKKRCIPQGMHRR